MIFNSKKEKFFFYDFPVILFTLIPLFLITGPFLSDLSISLISILFLLYCYKKKNFSYLKNNYFYFFLFFWGYLLFNSLINNFNFDSLKISFFYFRYGIFVFAIVALLNVDDKFIKYFFYSIFICFVALIFTGFYEYFYSKDNFHRVSSFFGDEEILGSYLSRLWPIFFGLSIFIYKQKNKIFYFFILIFILSEALIFLSGDRAPFFLINLSAIFVILFSKNLLKLRLLTLLSSILLIVIISYFNPTAKERVINQTLTQMNLIDVDRGDLTIPSDIPEYDGMYAFTKSHTHKYITAYKMFLDNKFLGVGVKNFRIFCSDKKYHVSGFSCSTHPHNTYFQILSETGIIGFLFLITTLIYFCVYMAKHLYLKLKIKKLYFSDFEICVLSGLAIYLWPFVPTGSFFNNWLNIAMILNLPFLIWSRNLNKLKN